MELDKCIESALRSLLRNPIVSLLRQIGFASILNRWTQYRFAQLCRQLLHFPTGLCPAHKSKPTQSPQGVHPEATSSQQRLPKKRRRTQREECPGT